MAMTLQEYLSVDTFLQTPADVAVHRCSGQKDFPVGNAPTRILVIEDMAHDPIMRYPSLAAAAGYRFHRGKIFEVEGRGEVALLEFHRKEPDNAESPH